MTCPQVLFLCWCSSILAVTCCMKVDGYSCTSDYWHTITCVLNITSNPVGQSNTTYRLKFKPRYESNSVACENCLAINHGYICVCKLNHGERFHIEDSYDIDICLFESGCEKLTENFEPSQNIQLTPPHKADIQQTPEAFNITWKSGYEDHQYLGGFLDYDLLLQTPQSKIYNTLQPNYGENSVLIPKSQLIPDATYCIKLRSKPGPDDYNGIWSKWSPQTCWKTDAIAVDGYSCTSDYWHTITCVLNITSNPVGQSNTTYRLKFKPRYESNSVACENCLAINHGYICVCKLNHSERFHTADSYDIDICLFESGCEKLTENFEPSRNIQLTPPHKADIQQTPEAFNITWKSGYEDHPFLGGFLDYDLLLQTPQSKIYNTLQPNYGENSVLIPKSQLIPGATYCIKLRSKPGPGDYNGIWSKWSPQTCWKTDAIAEQENIFVILTQSLGPVCVVVGVLLFVFSNPAARMKIKTLSHTPSPAPFFQPLFKQHEGNFQEWLSPQGKFVLTYKNEEILTTDIVTIVPKSITKDPEENQDFHNPPVTQLTFTQCQSSYVGLPGVQVTSPPLTMVCPGNTSYTQLPCPMWGLSIAEVESVVSSPANDFFDVSCTDSGCSFEDLTQISECSLPNSPVDYNPPPSSDYCILNKTAEGVVPVLISKGSSPNVPSDFPEEGESLKSE